MISLGNDRLEQGNYRAAGVVLRRRESGGKAGSQDLLLFLQDCGALWVGAPGADGAKNRFGGGTEPMVWACFDLYQSPRRLYLKGVDVREDFLSLRRSRRALLTAVGWCGKLAEHLPAGHEDNGLLSLLWGSMKNLAAGADAALCDLRFAWRWSNLWGTAPQLENCCRCGRGLSDAGGASFVLSRAGLLCSRCDGGCADPSDARDLGVAHPILRPGDLALLRAAAMSQRTAFLTFARAANRTEVEAMRVLRDWLYSFL